MRVISMVPSWTETLIEAGIEVVGRTRFCVHPSDKVHGIPVVGGTKDIDWEKLESLSADLLILDREENPKSMSDESPIEVLATHVRSIADVAPELEAIARRLRNGVVGESPKRASTEAAARALDALANRWQANASKSSLPLDWRKLPGVMEWLGEIPDTKFDRAIYLIWKNPDMCAGPGTFIASVLEKLGLSQTHLWPGVLPDENDSSQKYPVVEWDHVPANTVILASSEPFPFHKRKDDLFSYGRPVAIVDGESFSWFGLRSLRFLDKSLN